MDRQSPNRWFQTCPTAGWRRAGVFRHNLFHPMRSKFPREPSEINLSDSINESLVLSRVDAFRDQPALPLRFPCKLRQPCIRHPYLDRPQSLSAQFAAVGADLVARWAGLSLLLRFGRHFRPRKVTCNQPRKAVLRKNCDRITLAGPFSWLFILKLRAPIRVRDGSPLIALWLDLLANACLVPNYGLYRWEPQCGEQMRLG